MIDVGTGSGVLAIAAAKLGAASRRRVRRRSRGAAERAGERRAQRCRGVDRGARGGSRRPTRTTRRASSWPTSPVRSSRACEAAGEARRAGRCAHRQRLQYRGSPPTSRTRSAAPLPGRWLKATGRRSCSEFEPGRSEANGFDTKDRDERRRTKAVEARRPADRTRRRPNGRRVVSRRAANSKHLRTLRVLRVPPLSRYRPRFARRGRSSARLRSSSFLRL